MHRISNYYFMIIQIEALVRIAKPEIKFKRMIVTCSFNSASLFGLNRVMLTQLSITTIQFRNA